MKKSNSHFLLITATVLLLLFHGRSSAQFQTQDINWQRFMDHQQMKWDQLGRDYYSGIILGNGLLGTNIYQEADSSIRFDIGRSDVVDQRQEALPEIGAVYTKARLPIGHFNLKTKGKIIRADLTLDLYNAEAKGVIYTTEGSLSLFAYVCADQNVIYIELHENGKERASGYQWIPARSISPRYLQSYPKDKPSDFPDNPTPHLYNENGYTVCTQPFLNKGAYSTAYKQGNNGAVKKLLVSIGYNQTNSQRSVSEAIQQLSAFEKRGEENSRQHRSWWHKFYQKSFVSLPDKRMENFYWIQLYKLAASTREDKLPLDLMGPWTDATPWPAIWWNLNIQLTYSPIFTANHLELGNPLFKSLHDHEQNLIQNVPAKWRHDAAAIGRPSSYDLISPITEKEIETGNFEAANLTWALYYYYQYYCYSQDTAALRNNIFPLLKKATNFILHLLQKDEKGMYHVPPSLSPEYAIAEDNNYTLSTLRWALSTLIKVDLENELQDPDADKWQEILRQLVPYPIGETGYLIGKNVALTSSHRHYSHLMMIYPFHLVDAGKENGRELIERSITHWLSLKGALQGYTYTGAASMYAALGDGQASYNLLNDFFDKYIQPNTLYREAGPVIETPLSAATSIQEMLLQSWGGNIKLFPAIPNEWKDISFRSLRTEGAFLVSADLRNDTIRYIGIQSLAGNPCTLVLRNRGSLSVTSDKRSDVQYTIDQHQNTTRIQILHTLKGETLSIRTDPMYKVEQYDVPYTIHSTWNWGVNNK